MPTYEYACASCDATHEVQQKMSDPTLTECPVCGAPGVRKLFTGVGIHFKGSGFYRTDSRDAKSGSSATKTSDSSAGSSSSSSASKSDSGSSSTSSSGSSTGSGGGGSSSSGSSSTSSASTAAAS